MNERQELMARFEAVQRCLAKNFSAREALHSFGAMTMHQLTALREVAEHGPLTMHQLAARLEVGASAITQLVDRLEQQGLVERAGDPNDRRVLRVATTEKAKDAVTQFKKSRRRQLSTMFDRLTDDELRTFIDLAERMAATDTAAAKEA